MVAMITDFGTRDYFVGVMKGVIRKIAPMAEVVDIVHDIPSYNILPACFALEKSYLYFPDYTIFLVVVDPGVGSKRKILLVEHDTRYFIAPDNGVLTPILQKKEKSVWTLDKKKYFLIKEATTFEARDKMSPAAAYLAAGLDPKKLASPVSKYTLNLDYFPTRGAHTIDGRIIYIDKFGNIMTNISREYLLDAQEASGKTNYKATVGGTEITGRYDTYSSAGADSWPKPFMLIGSHRNLEIAMNRQSAALALDAVYGQKVLITFY